MSKYTTEVRFICENKSGLNESVGMSSVDDVISKSWDKIFTTKCEVFDEAYRSVICKKILKHYYLREIGTETVGVWMLWMNTRFEEIMPYYNQLYASELIKFDPMHDVNLTRKQNRKLDNTTKEDGTSTNTRDNTGNRTENGKSNNSNSSKDLYSDTPQGALTGVETETYLTNARKVDDNGEQTTNNTSNYTENITDNGTTTNNGISNTTEDYLETVMGKQGTESYSDLLLKYRKTFLNIDMQVIEEFSDLFMGLW